VKNKSKCLIILNLLLSVIVIGICVSKSHTAHINYIVGTKSIDGINCFKAKVIMSHRIGKKKEKNPYIINRRFKDEYKKMYKNDSNNKLHDIVNK
jgi:hypothetical protein